MNTPPVRGVPAFVASNRAGHTAAIILAIFEAAEAEQMLAAEAEALAALERVVRSTQYKEFRSFSVQKQSIEWMDARVDFVMGSALESDNTVLYARCDSPETRDAFWKTLRRSYEVSPIALGQQAVA